MVVASGQLSSAKNPPRPNNCYVATPNIWHPIVVYVGKHTRQYGQYIRELVAVRACMGVARCYSKYGWE